MESAKKFGFGSLLRGFASGIMTGLGLEVAGELYNFARGKVQTLTEKKRISAVVAEPDCKAESK